MLEPKNPTLGIPNLLARFVSEQNNSIQLRDLDILTRNLRRAQAEYKY